MQLNLIYMEDTSYPIYLYKVIIIIIATEKSEKKCFFFKPKGKYLKKSQKYLYISVQTFEKLIARRESMKYASSNEQQKMKCCMHETLDDLNKESHFQMFFENATTCISKN